MKEQLIEWLKDEKWYPTLNGYTTDVELKTAELLNQIIDRIIEKLNELV